MASDGTTSAANTPTILAVCEARRIVPRGQLSATAQAPIAASDSRSGISGAGPTTRVAAADASRAPAAQPAAAASRRIVVRCCRQATAIAREMSAALQNTPAWSRIRPKPRAIREALSGCSEKWRRSSVVRETMFCRKRS